jgi:protein-L-isoaspartate(D-aspartate) O-methyltransferase
MLSRSERQERRAMVKKQIARRGISDRRVLGAMAAVPRECFVPRDQRHLAYADQPLPIGLDQTISQPYIVALMAEQARLTRRSKVLEVGTGSGYAAAVFAKIANHVWTIERLQPLADEARHRFAEMGFDNITTVVADGALGYGAASPYDAIIVAAAAPFAPLQLREQLALGGRLVIPVGDRTFQDLCVIERTETGYSERTAGSCRFVPLVSPEAFNE